MEVESCAVMVEPDFCLVEHRRNAVPVADGCRPRLGGLPRHLADLPVDGVVLMLPLAAVMVLFSGPIVRLLYQRGNFTPADTLLVSRVQAMYAFQLAFTGVGMLYGRVLVAMKRTDLVMASAALNLALDIVLNLICMRYLGVAGIALATSLFYFGTFLFFRTMARRLLGRQMKMQTALAVGTSCA